MQKFHRNITLERFDKFTSNQYFQDVNLLSKLHKVRSNKTIEIAVWSAPGLERVPFTQAIKESFKATCAGESFGPSWSTHWFHITLVIPPEFSDEIVSFRWDADSEALIWSPDGRPLQGLTGGEGWDRRVEYLLTNNATPGQRFEFYLEMACNGMFGVGNNGQINPPDPNRFFKLKTCDIVAVDQQILKLWYDFQVIAGIARELPTDSQRGCQALRTANAIINAFMPDDKSTWEHSQALASEFLQCRSGDGTHQITAVGHCHIDTAWLWPYDETKRKCARSWATQIRLMEKYPEFKFVCSQAQQFEWTLELYPALFEEIKTKVSTGQFIPIGGTWVEMDCNVPSGESLVRQFLYGQRFFESHFGKRCNIFWLPDTFGYAAQLPQIIKQSDIEFFLTQKLSWNNINKFPYTTFYWTGLDGSSVLTHFPPADTYTGQADVREVLYSVKNHKDKEYSGQCLQVIGHGDGGGGPNEAMIERIKRMGNLDGLPNVSFGDPNDFFSNVRNECKEITEWKGELYFELHRGTYTSQAANKKFNRKSEFLLRDVEILFVMADASFRNLAFPKIELDVLWKLMLLNQFHDVLPGSSIGCVYEDSGRHYKQISESGEKLKQKALEYVFRKFISESKKKPDERVIEEVLSSCLCPTPILRKPILSKLHSETFAIFAVNTLGVRRHEVVEISLGDNPSCRVDFPQVSAEGDKVLALVEIDGLSAAITPISKNELASSAKGYAMPNGTFILENSVITVCFDRNGRMISMYDKIEKRDCVAPGQQGNCFKIYEDIPLFWDAWDVEVYHLEKGWNAGIGEAHLTETGPLRASLTVKHPITANSILEQTISINAFSKRVDFDTKVDWNENRKFLKVEFPFDINSDVCTYETPFGWVQRPTHFNTPWDLAKFEVCGHKFADLSEFGYGVALLNDSKYGYATHKNIMRLSLLRAPKAPDDQCDIGHHEFKYAIFSHKGTFAEADVVNEALKFNVPITCRIVPELQIANEISKPLFSVDAPNVVLDTVKKCEDSNDIVVRLYEAYGGRVQTKLRSRLLLKSACITNLLEDPQSQLEVGPDGSVALSVKPFQIVTIKCTIYWPE